MDIKVDDSTFSKDPVCHTPWNLWFHFNKDTGWDIENYQMLFHFKTLRPFCQLIKHGIDLNAGIYFMMRDGVLPMWEDPANVNGCIWSFKVHLDNGKRVWEEICIRLVGESLVSDMNINGVSIHPKHHCFLVKLWMKKPSSRLTFCKPSIPHVSVTQARMKKHPRHKLKMSRCRIKHHHR